MCRSEPHKYELRGKRILRCEGIHRTIGASKWPEVGVGSDLDTDSSNESRV